MFLRDSYHRFLPAQTSDQVWSSPSWMQLDVGEADRTQSRAPSDALSSCTGHAAADSSQCSSVFGRSDCTGGFGKADVSCFFGSADVVWATSKLDRNFWLTRRCSGRQLGVVQEAIHAQIPTKIDENCPSCSVLGPSSRQQVPVESESLPETSTPTPDGKGGILHEECNDVLESRGAASTRPTSWQTGGQRNQRRKVVIACVEVSTGGFWTTTPTVCACWSSI